MNKGHTVENAIIQAKKLNQANIPFSTVIMYGIAGAGKSIDNAIATANMINQFSTKRIITMCLTVFFGTPLENMVERGDFILSSSMERLAELKVLLEYLNPEQPTMFDTTHPTNIVKLKGTLPWDKQRLINEIDSC